MNPEGRAPQAPRGVLPEAVAEQIQTRILDGTFRAGDRLPPERELAAQLGVNRSSVREALKKLEQLRLVSIQQGSGIRIQSPDQASFDLVGALLFTGERANLPRIRDLLELRELVGAGVLRLALERGSSAEGAALMECLRHAVDPELRGEDFMRGLHDLEEGLARMSGNRILLLLSNSLARFMAQHAIRAASAAVACDRSPYLSFLRRFAVAFEARDLERAQAAWLEISRRMTRAILKALEAPDASA